MLLFLVPLVLLMTRVIADCPSMDRLTNCSCSVIDTFQGGRELSLTCTGSKDLDATLKLAARNFGKQIVDKLRLVRGAFVNFTKENIGRLRVKYIEVSSTPVGSISGHDLSFQNDLEYLAMDDCEMNEDEANIQSLRNLVSLRSLLLQGNRFTRVLSIWFQDKKPVNLHNIHLRRNQISTVDPYAFRTLENLEFLDLSENFITQLKKDMFPEGLRSLFLSYNEIKKLPDDFFEDMTTTLKRIALDYNQITVLEEAVWSQTYHGLQRLDLSENPIACNCTLKWLAELESQRLHYFFGKCHSPDEVRGKILAKLKRTDIICQHSKK